jgi:hypothetical protein
LMWAVVTGAPGKLIEATKGARTKQPPVAFGDAAKPFVAWGFLTIFLLLIASPGPSQAEKGTRAELATSFAWLLLIAVFLAYGFDIFNAINKQITGEEK